MIDPQTRAAIRQAVIDAFPSGDIYDETDANRLLDTSPYRARAAQIGSKVKSAFQSQAMRVSAEGHGEGGTCTWITVEKDAPNAFTLLAYVSFVGPFAYLSEIDPDNSVAVEAEQVVRRHITDNAVTILDRADAQSEATLIEDFPPGSGEDVALTDALFNEGL